MPKKQTPKILVFEDKDIEYSALQPRLEKAGYWAIRARTPEEFTGHAPWPDFVLIIIDLFLGQGPDKRPVGIDLTREVHKRNPRVPIVVCSKLEPDRHDVAESFRAGARDYIDKYVLLNDIENILNRYVREAGEAWIRGAEDELPLPMSFLLRDLRRYRTNPRQRLDRMIELFEVTLKMIAFAIISADPSKTRQLTKDLREAFGRPSLGHLSRLIDALPVPDGPVRALAEAAHRPRFREITGTLINVRNDFIGHGALQSDVMYERQIAAHEPEILELLKSLDAIREMRLVWLTPSAMTEEGRHHYEMKVFAGSNPEPETDSVSFDESLVTPKVYLLDAGREHALKIDPFCQYLVCDQCLRHKLFLYRLARQGELWMIDHVYGHSIQTRTGWDTYQRLFGE